MKCMKCDKKLNDENLKPYLIFPCCDIICMECLNASDSNSCVICNVSITSKLLRRVQELCQNSYQNKYKEVCFLASGAFACVYIVQDEKDKKLYALKAIQSKLIFECPNNEIGLLIRLQSEFIISYKDAFNEGVLFCILTEYCEGGNLALRIKEKRKNKRNFTHELIFKWVCEMLKGIDYLHSQKVLHRDIKPANIFMCIDDHLKIGDLGIAKPFDTTIMFSTVAGTLKYMSPEMRKKINYSSKTDIWSLGCILFELIKLEKYFNYYEYYNLEMISEKVDLFKHFDSLNIFKSLLKSMLVINEEKRSYSKQLITLTESCDLNQEIDIFNKNKHYYKKDPFKRQISPFYLAESSLNIDFSTEQNFTIEKKVNKFGFKKSFFKKINTKTTKLVLMLLFLFILLIVLVFFFTIKLIMDKAHKRKGHLGPVRTIIEISSNNFASGGEDGIILIWDANNLLVKKRLIGHNESILSLLFLGENLLASGSKDGNINIWNITSGQIYRNWRLKKKPISTLMKLENGDIVSTSYFDTFIYVWNKESPKFIRRICAHERGINQIVKLNEKYFVSGSFESRIKLWNMNNLKIINEYDIKDEVLNLVKITSDSFLSMSYKSSFDYFVFNETLNNLTRFNLPIVHDIDSFALLEENKLAISSSNKIDVLQFQSTRSNLFLNSILSPLINCSKQISALAVLKNNLMVYGLTDGIINKLNLNNTIPKILIKKISSN